MGYMWRYEKKENLKPYKSNKEIRIQATRGVNDIKIFESLTEAAKDFDRSIAGIKYAVDRNNTLKGYRLEKL